MDHYCSSEEKEVGNYLLFQMCENIEMVNDDTNIYQMEKFIDFGYTEFNKLGGINSVWQDKNVLIYKKATSGQGYGIVGYELWIRTMDPYCRSKEKKVAKLFIIIRDMREY